MLRSSAAFVLLALAGASTALAQGPTFVVFTAPGAGESIGPDDVKVSRDGRFAAACATAGLNSLALLVDTATGTTVDLGGLNAQVNSFALSINGDGSVIGGDSYNGIGALINRPAVAWQISGGAAAGLTNMGDLAGGLLLARALAVNSAGTQFAGYGSVPGSIRAATWTFDPATGVASAPTDQSGSLPADANATTRRSRFTASNGSGTVLAGFYERASLLTRAMVKTGPVITGLDDPQGDGDFSEAHGVSADGSVVVGVSGIDAVAWISGPGGVWNANVLPFLGGAGDEANAASADGSVIVGNSGEAVVWRDGSVESLSGILTAAGVDLLGLTLTRATDVSDDGRTIVGIATDASTVDYGFIVTLPAPGCPADIGSAGGQAGPDGVLDNNDFIVFIDLFFNQANEADIGSTGGTPGSDGLFDNNDFIVFIDRFFAGC